MNKNIAVYDNTVKAREYLSYISEQAGGFACIGRDGKLYIRTIGIDTVNIDIELFGDFSWGEHFKVSRVVYEDGVQLFEKGDTSENTIYINQDNMYIVDQEQIDNIYNLYKDLEVYSFEGDSIIDPALDVGDILIIDGKKVIYQGSSQYAGKFKASISSKIQSKVQEETTTRTTSQKVINRRVQSQIDQAEGKITQLTQEQSEYENKLTTIEQTVDSINQNVGDIIDYKREIDSITEAHLTDAGKMDILKLEVKGNKTYESNLFPSDNLFPSESLYPNMEGSELI